MSRYALTEEFERLLGYPITERGKNVMVRCWAHEDRSPSLSLDLERGLYICFQCGRRGNIYKLAFELGQELDETSVILSTYRHVPDSYEPHDFAEMAEELHANAERDRPIEIVKYLRQRGISASAFRHWKLGWTGTAISLPYYDEGRVVAIKYRAPNGFKWYETGSRPGLYGINDVRSKAYVALTEGESDTHALWSTLQDRVRLDKSSCSDVTFGVAGVPGVGAGQPSRSTWELWALDLFWAKHIFVAFDADEAGDAGSVIPLSIFGEKGSRARPPLGKDVAEFLMQGGTIDGLLGIANARV